MLKHQIIQFVVMFIIGLTLNPMNILAYSPYDLYLSPTLIYGALFMASNMIWSHELIMWLSSGKINLIVLLIGFLLSGICIILLRSQFLIGDKGWLRRMIPHHSTALTTSINIINKSKNDDILKLADDIIATQEREIALMKSLLLN
jgi:hypothetical protein